MQSVVTATFGAKVGSAEFVRCSLSPVRQQSKAFPYLSAGIAFAPQIKQNEKGIPQAYLQYIAYDSAGNYLNSKYQLLDSEAKGNWQKLQLTYTATEPGYVDVFIGINKRRTLDIVEWL